MLPATNYNKGRKIKKVKCTTKTSTKDKQTKEEKKNTMIMKLSDRKATLNLTSMMMVRKKVKRNKT